MAKGGRERRVWSAMRLRLKRWWRSIIHARGTPEAVAMGASLGLFAGMMPAPGFQMLLAVFLATVLGGSRIPAIITTYITNPLTAIPLFALCYKLGRFCLLGWLGFETPNWEEAKHLFVNLMEFSGMREAFAKFGALLGLSARVLLPLWVGSVLVGVVLALVAYPIVLRLVKGHRLIQAQKRARRLEREQPKPPEGG